MMMMVVQFEPQCPVPVCPVCFGASQWDLVVIRTDLARVPLSKTDLAGFNHRLDSTETELFDPILLQQRHSPSHLTEVSESEGA